MNLVKNSKIYIVIFSACILLLVTVRGVYYDQNSCMGVPLISDSRLDAYTEDLIIDLSDITFNEESVAVDTIRNTIYISQSSEMINHWSDLQGKLEINNSRQDIYFLDNIQLQNLKETVTTADYLTLVVIEDNSMCKIKVAVSNLPIISLNGEASGEVTEKGHPVLVGDMTIFAGYNPGVGILDVESCSLEWHLRGGKSAKLSKQPQKLSLKKKNGDNLNMDLLGMGADDDWILNPMNLDDTKLREKTAIEVWNNYIMDSSADYPMSTSQYVEVVINGQYQGLYLLQRRIDEKYLKIDKKTDLIFKGRQVWVANNVVEGYELVYSPYDEMQSYALLQEYLLEVDETNYVNVNTFLHYLSAMDNTGYKNMFYILRQGNDGRYTMHLLPWDTDVSMGMIPSAGFINWYDYNQAIWMDSRRMEYYNVMLTYVDLDADMRARWYELTDVVFGENGIYEKILDENKQYILDSGAFTRDKNHWGFVYEGRDSMENLYKWNIEKTKLINEFWRKYEGE